MPYDLVIKNGALIDGSGLPRYRADVAVRHGRIVATGRIRERAREVIDADGLVVGPGFIDGHTHMDAQVFWDPLGTCSCWHGVTTVVMGNCGFTLAPCGKAERHLVVRNLERAEDIAAEADAGIDRTWTASTPCPKASTTPATSATRRYAPTPWASAPSRRKRVRTICARWSASCATPFAPARSASRPRARRATRRPTGVRSPAAWPRGTRCAGWSASWAR